MIISKNRNNKHIKNNKQARKEEIIYGKNACLGCIDGYRNGRKNREIYTIYILQEKYNEYLNKIPQELKNIIQKVNQHELFIMTHEQDKHQGIACKVSNFRFSSIDDIIGVNNNKDTFVNKSNYNDKNSKHSIFLLDRVQDPHNLGNIIRTAFCFGIDGIILPERDSCGITPAVVRTSVGYSEKIPICQVVNVANTIDKMKQNGYSIIGFDVNTNTNDDLTKIIEKNDKFVFIFGSEGKGMKDLTKKKCDILLRLPMAYDAESLNVANTTAIVGWEIMKAKIK